MASNAERFQKHQAKLRDMVRHGAKITIENRTLRNNRSGDEWYITLYWPDYGYYQISRTYTSHNRDYTKSHLISQKVLETNYVETSAKAA